MSARAFVCVECARAIVSLCEPPNSPNLCGACRTIPGWFRIAALRDAIDPDHDGREYLELLAEEIAERERESRL